MKPLHSPAATLVSVVTLVSLVTGCSSDGATSGPTVTAAGPVPTVATADPPVATSTTSVPPSSGASAPATTTTTATTVTVDAGPGPDVTIDEAVEREGLDALLLDIGDLGPGFVESDATLPAGTTPCGFSVDEQFPAEQHRTVLQAPTSGLSLFEELRFYPNTRVAAAAYDAIVAGLSCGGNDEFTLGEVTDVSFELDATAIAVSYSNADVEGVIVVAELAEVLVGLQFQGPPGAAAAATAPDPLALARLAVHRVVAYSEA